MGSGLGDTQDLLIPPPVTPTEVSLHLTLHFLPVGTLSQTRSQVLHVLDFCPTSSTSTTGSGQLFRAKGSSELLGGTALDPICPGNKAPGFKLFFLEFYKPIA